MKYSYGVSRDRTVMIKTFLYRMVFLTSSSYLETDVLNVYICAIALGIRSEEFHDYISIRISLDAIVIP